MSKASNELMEMFCTALEMKEKKKALYEESMNGCSDSDNIGRETFRMLRDAEAEDSKRIQEVYENLKRGKEWVDACRYYPDHSEGTKSLFGKIIAKYAAKPKACTDQVGAIDTGLELEDAAIRFFEERLSKSEDAVERQFLESMAVDDREHYRTLADLKFYYTDPEGWFIEKSGTTLDGGN